MMSAVSIETSGWATTIVAQPGVPETPAERKKLLVDTLFEVVEGLNESVRSQDRRTVVDVRVGESLTSSARTNVAAFVAAVKGLVQTLTLELPPESPTVNLIVSRESQSSERQRTSEYLLSDEGGYSLGTTYDLREENA